MVLLRGKRSEQRLSKNHELKNISNRFSSYLHEEDGQSEKLKTIQSTQPVECLNSSASLPTSGPQPLQNTSTVRQFANVATEKQKFLPPKPADPANMPTKPLYMPLADDGEIRLVHLQPRGPDDNVQCLIKHSKLKDNIAYEALSYAWGDAADEQSLKVDDSSSYQIWPNLRSALYHLRLEGRERVLWIDALCINQRDINERNHQVRQMGNIYQSASKVVIWLGEADDSSEVAMLYLSDFNYNQTISSTSKTGHILYSLKTLGERAYWSRLWIIQEIVLGKKVLVQCGHNILSWDRLARVLQINDNVLRLPSYRAKALRFLASSGYFNEEGITLYKLISIYSVQESKEPRDRVFALLNLAEECCQSAITVDYSLPLVDILLKVAIHHASEHLPKDPTDNQGQQLERILASLYHALDLKRNFQ